MCHVGFVHDDGPVVIPMLHARRDDDLLLHGAPGTRLVRVLRQGTPVCVTVTLVDGIVLARSAFNHSLDYRSVVVFGSAHPVTALDERRAALDALTDRLVPGRRSHLRPMSDTEVRATAVLRIPLAEASAKVRSGPPHDDEEDYHLPIWAGVLPLRLAPGEPVPDPRNQPALDTPAHVRLWRRP